MELKSGIFKNVFFFGVLSLLFSFDLPSGWFKAGSHPKSYEMGIDKGSGQDGQNAATIKSIDKEIDGFGTLMQGFLSEKFLDQRVRMTGLMKSSDVADWAGFWLRVDHTASQQYLSFDNMENRAIKGTTDWTKYEIVLDVPKEASNIAFGALLSGTGQVWFDDIKFEVVDKSVPVTCEKVKYIEAQNLNFEN